MITNLGSVNGFDIVMVITVILFARLGIRLLSAFFKMRKDDSTKDEISKPEDQG